MQFELRDIPGRKGRMRGHPQLPFVPAVGDPALEPCQRYYVWPQLHFLHPSQLHVSREEAQRVMHRLVQGRRSASAGACVRQRLRRFLPGSPVSIEWAPEDGPCRTAPDLSERNALGSKSPVGGAWPAHLYKRVNCGQPFTAKINSGSKTHTVVACRVRAVSQRPRARSGGS